MAEDAAAHGFTCAGWERTGSGERRGGDERVLARGIPHCPQLPSSHAMGPWTHFLAASPTCMTRTNRWPRPTGPPAPPSFMCLAPASSSPTMVGGRAGSAGGQRLDVADCAAARPPSTLPLPRPQASLTSADPASTAVIRPSQVGRALARERRKCMLQADAAECSNLRANSAASSSSPPPPPPPPSNNTCR
jgi:hypothetical protein